jgi:hypothetical protein
MKCTRCNEAIPEGDERDHLGDTLCEDCYMDALSTTKACDPWAVYSAKSFGNEIAGKFELTDLQQKIIGILKEKEGAQFEYLIGILNISPKDLDREIAALRHMEKVRAELRGKEKFLRLW